MNYGFHGNILQIDLGTKTVNNRQDIDSRLWQKYLGASGICVHIFLKEFDPQVDPLAPEAPLFFMRGLFAGTMAPTGCKFSVVCKSPLTGIWNESTSGGQFGAMMTFAGIDGLVITGRAERPSYIYLKEDGVAEIHPCDEILMADTIQTDNWLRERTNKKAETAVVGPAAFKGVKYCAVLVGGEHTRAAARCGVGTVMAAKNIKGIVAYGKKRPAIYDRKGFLEHLKPYIADLKKNTKAFSQFGTTGAMTGVEANGDLPIKNWKLGSWPEGAEKISAQRIAADGLRISHTGCFSCPIRCGKLLEVKDQKWSEYVGVKAPQQEYETSAGFGSNLLNDDPQSITIANYLCNAYGLDTISTAACIAFAFEAFENGVITEKDTQNVPLRWGDPKAIVHMIHLIGKREAIGKLLGEGVKIAAEVLGKGSEAYAVHAKGLELPFHDPRAFTSMGVGYATANRGGCHLETLSFLAELGVLFEEFGFKAGENPFVGHFGDLDGKAKLAVQYQNYMNALNSVGLCKFAFRCGTGPEEVTKWINFITGWKMTAEEFLEVGERLHNIKRIFNLKIGMMDNADILPPRVGRDPRPDGKAKGYLPHLEKTLPDYYKIRGWNEEGIPKSETLERLEISSYADKD